METTSDAATRLNTAARATLAAWRAPDAAQEGLRSAYLAHLAEHPDGAVKAGPPEHLTVSCLVLADDGRSVLLTHHRKARAWFQFGGHLEAHDASLRDGAAREAREESGLPGLELTAAPLQLDRHALHGDFTHCREHLDVRYAALAPRTAVPVTSEESLAVRWWPVEDLPTPVEESMVRLIDLARAAYGLG